MSNGTFLSNQECDLKKMGQIPISFLSVLPLLGLNYRCNKGQAQNRVNKAKVAKLKGVPGNEGDSGGRGARENGPTTSVLSSTAHHGVHQQRTYEGSSCSTSTLDIVILSHFSHSTGCVGLSQEFIQ